MIGFILLCILVVIVYVLFNIVIVEENKFTLTRRFGRNCRVLHTGLNILMPFERVVMLKWNACDEDASGNVTTVLKEVSSFPLSEAKLDPPPVDALTKDSAETEINGVMWWHIVRSDNMFAILNSAESPLEQLNDLFKTAVLNVAGSRTLTQLRDSVGGDLASSIRKNLIEIIGGKLPIVVDRVAIQSVDFTDEKLVSELARMAEAKQKWIYEKEMLEVQRATIEATAHNQIARAQADAAYKKIRSLADAERLGIFESAKAKAMRETLASIIGSGIPPNDVIKVFEAVEREVLYSKINNRTTLIMGNGSERVAPIICTRTNEEVATADTVHDISDDDDLPETDKPK